MSKKKKTNSLSEPIKYVVRVGIYCAYSHKVLDDWYDTIYCVERPSNDELKHIYGSFLQQLADHDLVTDGMSLNGFIEVAPVIQYIEVETEVSIKRFHNGKENEKKYN